MNTIYIQQVIYTIYMEIGYFFQQENTVLVCYCKSFHHETSSGKIFIFCMISILTAVVTWTRPVLFSRILMGPQP